LSLNRKTNQQIKSEKTVQDLMNAAAELFQQYKINEVGVRDIAEKANVTTGTFYYYFKSKNDILDKVYHSADKEFENIFKTGLSKTVYCEKIVEFFCSVLANKVMKDGVDFTRYRMFEMRIHSTTENELYRGMIELIKKAQETGELRNDFEAEEMNNFLFLVFRGTIYEWCIQEKQFELVKELEKAIGYAIRSFSMN